MNLTGTIARIRHMEQLFDALLTAAESTPSSIRTDPALRASLRELTAYYDGGQWRHDYELDEANALPADLKRGVLSEDGVYDLLTSLCAFAQDELSDPPEQ